MKRKAYSNEYLLDRAMRLARTAIESIDNKLMRDTLENLYLEIDLKINHNEELEDR
jgi:hypothetical protein